MRSVAFADGAVVPALGQGTWRMGEGGDPADEIASLRAGLALGFTLIDTAEMYANGGAERVVGRAIDGRRDEVFLVSKVLPSHALTARAIRVACENSLRRLNTDRLDLYLLHWRSGEVLGDVVDAFERLKADGLILRWGVSNFDADDVDELLALPDGASVAANQVLYNPDARGIEFDLIPSCRSRRIPLMAYSPLGQGGALLAAPALRAVAARHGVDVAAVLLAWTMRHPDVIAIPKTGSVARCRENARGATLALDADDLRAIDHAFPPPVAKEALGML